MQFIAYLAKNVDLSADLIETLTRRAYDNIEKQTEAGVQKLLNSMSKIIAGWEQEDTSTVSSIQTTTLTIQTSTDTTEDSTTLTDSTTLGASTLSSHISILLVVLIILKLFK